MKKTDFWLKCNFGVMGAEFWVLNVATFKSHCGCLFCSKKKQDSGGQVWPGSQLWCGLRPLSSAVAKATLDTNRVMQTMKNANFP